MITVCTCGEAPERSAMHVADPSHGVYVSARYAAARALDAANLLTGELEEA